MLDGQAIDIAGRKWDVECLAKYHGNGLVACGILEALALAGRPAPKACAALYNNIPIGPAPIINTDLPGSIKILSKPLIQQAKGSVKLASS